MKTKRRLLTRQELLDLEDKYFQGGLGNLVSLGAAHFGQSHRENGGGKHPRNGVAPNAKRVVH